VFYGTQVFRRLSTRISAASGRDLLASIVRQQFRNTFVKIRERRSGQIPTAGQEISEEEYRSMPAPTLKDLLVRIRAIESAVVKMMADSKAPKKAKKAPAKPAAKKAAPAKAKAAAKPKAAKPAAKPVAKAASKANGKAASAAMLPAKAKAPARAKQVAMQ